MFCGRRVELSAKGLAVGTALNVADLRVAAAASASEKTVYGTIAYPEVR